MLFGMIDTAGSGLTAERLRMDVVANNLANANTTVTPDGGPYRRQVPIFAERLDRAMDGDLLRGVQVIGIREDPSPLRLAYEPNNPQADARGYVHYPNVNVATEMVDLISASRAYEANVTVVEAAKTMAVRALDILKA